MQPVVEIIDGSEVATLPPLPDLLDRDYFRRLDTLRTVRTVLPGTDTPLTFDPTSLVVLRNGDLLVHDPLAEQPLVILDPDAEAVVARFGRKGRGPGEIGDGLVGLLEAEDGTLVVSDASNLQIHTFRRDGTHLDSERIDLLPLTGIAVAEGELAFLVSTMQSSERYWSHGLRRLEVSGESTPLLDLPDLPEGQEYSFRGGRALWTLLPSGIVTMWGGVPVVYVHALDGALIREVHLPLETRMLTTQDIQAQMRQNGNMATGLRPGPMGITNAMTPLGDSVFGLYTSTLWRAAGDPELPEETRLLRLFETDGTYLGVMVNVTVVGRGDGETFWVKDLDEDLYPVLQEVRLVRSPRS